jgi:hypothetical protein
LLTRPRGSLLARSRKPAQPSNCARALARARRAPASRPRSGARLRVAAIRRRRRPGGVRWLQRSRSTSPAPRLTQPRPLTPPPLPSLPHNSKAAERLSSATAAPFLAGVGRSGHHNSPPEPPSSSKHRLLFAQPVLTSARNGNAPSRGNCSPEFHPSSPERTAPWTPTLCFPSSFLRARISSALLSRRSCTLSRTSPWSVLAARR